LKTESQYLGDYIFLFSKHQREVTKCRVRGLSDITFSQFTKSKFSSGTKPRRHPSSVSFRIKYREFHNVLRDYKHL
jgi:hypothetical protein